MAIASNLYRLVFPNGKIYIGVANNPKTRLQGHVRNARVGKRSRLYDAMRKHGTPKMEVLLVGPRWYVLEMEIKAIAALHTQDLAVGYNLARGGQTSPVEGVGHTKASRQKMSRSRKGTGGSKAHMKRMAKIAAKRRQTPEYREKARAAALKRWARKGERVAQAKRTRARMQQDPNALAGFVRWNASGKRPAYVGRAISAAKQAKVKRRRCYPEIVLPDDYRI